MDAALLALLLAAAPDGPPSLLVASAGVRPGDARKAWDRVVELERYAAEWQPEWKHPVPQEQVRDGLAASLSTLGAAAAGAGAGIEVRLAAGLAARYAHNLDVEKAAEAGFDVLERAGRAFPDDPRPRWFLGRSLCEATHPVDGMNQLLAVEARPGAGDLPPQYWRDVLACATYAAMPARAARAGRNLARLGFPTDQDRLLLDRAGALLLPSSRDREYAVEEAWRADRADGLQRIASLPCGFEVALPASAEVRVGQVKGGACVMQAQLGPFLAGEERIHPFLLVAARVQRDGETLDQFARSIAPLGDTAPFGAQGCSPPSCQSYRVVRPDLYPHLGGGRFLVRALARSAPADPGLALERPRGLPGQAGGEPGKEAVRFFRPTPRQVRFPGTIFYLVAVDTGLAVEREAEAAWRKVLEAMVVE